MNSEGRNEEKGRASVAEGCSTTSVFACPEMNRRMEETPLTVQGFRKDRRAK